MVSQAQITSKENGGLQGIYRKVNTAPNFRADPQDILGSWNCVDIYHDIVYNAWEVSYTDTMKDLVSKGYLYENTSTAAWKFDNGTYCSLVSWGTSVPDEVPQSWDVKASIDVTNSSGNPGGLQTIRSYHCTMNTSSYEWILSKIQSQATLQLWTSGLFEMFGGALSPRPTNVTSILTSALNAMIMVGAGDEVSTAQPPTGDPTQGCLIPRAGIPWPVSTVLVTKTIGGFLIIVYWIVLRLQLRPMETKLLPNYAKEVTENSPCGLVGWMAYAVRENGGSQLVGPKDIARWNLSQADEGRLKICPNDSQSKSDKTYNRQTKNAGFVEGQE